MAVRANRLAAISCLGGLLLCAAFWSVLSQQADLPVSLAHDNGGGGGAGFVKLHDSFRRLDADLSALRRRLPALSSNTEQATPSKGGVGTQRRRAAVHSPSGYLQRKAAVESPNSADESIFVAVASFRDPDCPTTIANLFAQAAFPHRIHVGIAQQNGATDLECIPPAFVACQLQAFCPTDNVRIRRMSSGEAKGPTFARYVAMKLYRGERFVLMIDSHNVFVPRWDAVLLEMYHKLGNNKAVISHYPQDWNRATPRSSSGSNQANTSTSFLCEAMVTHLGIPKWKAILAPNAQRPRLQPFAAAGFLFADAALVHEVPLDPYLDFLFDGEEALYSARMWTHGWDMFSPSRDIMFHFYTREKAPKVWAEQSYQKLQERSIRRVQYLLDIVEKDGSRIVPDSTTEHEVIVEARKYGVGSARSLAAYWEFAGIDIRRQSSDNHWCDGVR